MLPYLNIHAHRAAVTPSEIVIRNLILTDDNSRKSPTYEAFNYDKMDFGESEEAAHPDAASATVQTNNPALHGMHTYPFAKGTDDMALPAGAFSVGIHPAYFPTDAKRSLHRLERLAAHPDCRAVGEAGIDKTLSTPPEAQAALFLRQARLATRLRLPLIVHCVRAWPELHAVKKSCPACRMIIHGFRGKPELATALVRAGLSLSFGFRYNPDSLKACPPSRLFLETDEDPRSVEELYQTVAPQLHLTVEQLRRQCLDNLAALFPNSMQRP